MDFDTLIHDLKRLSVETGSLVCLGCGHENSCGVRGCALIREAVQQLGEIPAADVAPVRWISVDERLPDGPGHYLICTSINYWHGGCLDKNEGHKHHKNCGTPMGYDGTTKSVLDCYYDITGDWNRVYNSHVTHWMPLPEPPGED